MAKKWSDLRWATMMKRLKVDTYRENGVLERHCGHGIGHPVGHIRGYLLPHETIHGCSGGCAGWKQMEVKKTVSKFTYNQGGLNG